MHEQVELFNVFHLKWHETVVSFYGSSIQITLLVNGT